MTLYYFWAFLAGGKVIYESDTPLVGYPTRYFAAWAIHNGYFPAWNPYYYLGYPFLAEGQAGMFYPLNVVFYALPLEKFTWIYHALLALHYWMAGCFAFIWLRRWVKADWIALWGAITFEFSGFMISHIFHVNLINVCAFLPLSLYLYDRTREEKGRLFWLGLVLVGTLQVLAGHFIALTICWTGVLGYALGLAFLGTFRSNRPAEHFRPVVGLALTLGAACLIGAPQLLPSFMLGRETGRVLIPQVNEGYLTLDFMRVLINPNVFGSLYFEKGGYIGLLPLLCLAIPFVRWRKSWKGTLPVFLVFLSLSLMSLWFTMGPYSSLYKWIAEVPPYSLLRYPSRYLMLVDLFAIAACASVLAALEVEWGAVKVLRAWRTSLIGLLFAVQFFDLMRMGHPYTVPTEAAYYDRIPARMAYLQSHLQPGERTMSAGFDYSPFNPQNALAGITERRYKDFIWTEDGHPVPSEVVPFYTATKYRIPMMAFYEQSTLIRQRYDIFMRKLQTHRTQEVINLIATGYLMIPKGKP
ncbi:MAG: hypothetical protein ACREJQ_06910, partial [bacterium]